VGSTGKCDLGKFDDIAQTLRMNGPVIHYKNECTLVTGNRRNQKGRTRKKTKKEEIEGSSGCCSGEQRRSEGTWDSTRIYIFYTTDIIFTICTVHEHPYVCIYMCDSEPSSCGSQCALGAREKTRAAVHRWIDNVPEMSSSP
jgi:hypothetical protein